ncbi:UNVERIFIED_CONTAM: hypothetical protein NCL1_42661 [Trichonephila clavipes]
MASQIPEEIHIIHYMLLEFHKGSNATVATKNICDVYPSALDVRKCQSSETALISTFRYVCASHVELSCPRKEARRTV